MNQWIPIIILIVVLILFGAGRFPDMARGMPESIRNWKAGSRPQPRRQDDDSRSFWLLALALIAVTVILSVLSLADFSGEQKLAVTVALLGWIGVGYWAFRRDDK
jgi:TatA/E family protein of Tat protein translocase